MFHFQAALPDYQCTTDESKCSGCRKTYQKGKELKVERTLTVGVTVDFHHECRPTEEEWRNFGEQIICNAQNYAEEYKWANVKQELASLKRKNEELEMELRNVKIKLSSKSELTDVKQL